MIDWNLAGSVILSGLFIVFAVLILLILAVTVMGKILNAIASSKKPAPPAAPTPPPAPVKAAAPVAAPKAAASGDETVAVIAAAVGAYMDVAAPGVPYTVTSVTPASGRSKQLRPEWGFAGMRQNTEPF